MHLTPAQLKHFQNKILTWYELHQRDLPWRKTRDPYYILVSEIMLQQTQVNRVIPKFELWLKAFPTVQDLANASTSEILKFWSGLGYNRRALNLKKAAQIVTDTYKGEFPQNEKELLALPGIGTYTARALLCFAFDKQVAVVDTNVRKVILTQLLSTNYANRHSGLSRIFYRSNVRDSGVASLPRMTNVEIKNIAEQLLPDGKAYEWNQALMDYSSAMLKNEKIPIPKQSKFIGSHRYYRGQVLKLLLEKKKIPVNKVGELIKKDFTKDDKVWIQKLLDDLVKEGFVVIHGKNIQLAS